MLANNPYERYKQTRVETAGPLQLIIMLYDGAIRFTRQAAHAIEERDYEKANEYLKRAQDIIDELNFSLNLEAGDIAKNLQQLYEFINHQLVQANVKKMLLLCKAWSGFWLLCGRLGMNCGSRKIKKRWEFNPWIRKLFKSCRNS